MAKAWLIAIAGCAYHPESFADWSGRFGGTHVTVGCVELGVGPATDPNVPGPIVAYELGNRCSHAVTVDLAKVRVIGRDANGVDHQLSAYDPDHEIGTAVLDARWAGRERIRYVGQDLPTLVSVCVDVGAVDTSVARSERWICGAP